LTVLFTAYATTELLLAEATYRFPPLSVESCVGFEMFPPSFKVWGVPNTWGEVSFNWKITLLEKSETYSLFPCFKTPRSEPLNKGEVMV